MKTKKNIKATATKVANMVCQNDKRWEHLRGADPKYLISRAQEELSSGAKAADVLGLLLLAATEQ
jgi:hypothetical protein